MIIKDENTLGVETADLKSESNRAAVAGQIARAEEGVKYEESRAQVNAWREEADTVVPARARREALILEAEGKSARTLEEGRFIAKAIELMREQWMNGETHDLFLVQLLPELLDKVTLVVSENLRVDKLTILDGGDGEGLPNHVKNLTSSAVVMLESMKNATGVDLEKLAQRSTSKGGSNIPKELSD